MERTDLREAFFAEVRNDPYAAAILHHVASAWADGYEQALRDHGLGDDKSHGERHSDAVEWLTEQRNESHARALIAFAQIGSLVGPKLGG